jgi:cupin 2 domain-containing protein
MINMNLFDLPQLPIPEELTTVLAESSHTRIERIVSTGQVSGWYDQSETEFVALLAGSAVIEYDNGKQPVSLSKGDTLLIPAHERHRVSYTSVEPPCVWLCVFMGK